MGAQDFEVQISGKNANAAFNAAVEDAQYEYGHGGYTGSIAEKQSFRQVNLDDEISTIVRDLRARRELCSVGTQRKLLATFNKRWDDLDGSANVYDYNKMKRELGIISTVADEIPQDVKKERARIDSEMKILTAKRNVNMSRRAGLIAYKLIDTKFSDKWGDAGCIEIKKASPRKDGEYLFFGLASS